MGDSIDGPSSAAHSAQDEDTEGQSKGFLGRIFDALSPSEAAANGYDLTPVPDTAYTSTTPGMLNLRRMRVEDVAIPKADIVAVPVAISKEDMVGVIRENWLTR